MFELGIIFVVGAAFFAAAFSLVYIFGGKKVREQIKKEW